MKRILITGENSYVGTAVQKWLSSKPNSYVIDTIDVRDDKWKDKEFNHYDVVFHVAGIAHVSTDPKMEDLYYKVNRNLTLEIAKRSKLSGVKQFIFMSSIIVYGEKKNEAGLINEFTIPEPSNFYGKSKLLAEEGLKEIENDHFKVVIVRPPMIYGNGSKGNYPRLASFSRKTPIFPNYNNKRSMLHIDNLSEFIRLMIDNEESGTFYPQNKEYVKTSDLVFAIAKIHNRKVFRTRIFNPLIKLFLPLNVVGKVFGTMVYEQNMSVYEKADYQIRTFEESIALTESERN